jgi:hypothetical protein
VQKFVNPEQTMNVPQDDAKNRVVIPGRLVRDGQDVVKVSHRGQSSVPEPRVELIRRGDEVEAIEVICGCGERIRLRCVYQDKTS